MSRIYELLQQSGKLLDGERRKSASAPRLQTSNMLGLQAPTDSKTDALDLDLHTVLQALFRRRVWIFACTGALTVAVALVCMVMTPQYRAESRLELLRQDPSGLSLRNGAAAEDANALDFNLNLQTQIALLMSDSLAWQVIQKLKLADDSTIAAAQAAKAVGNVSHAGPANDPEVRERAALVLKAFKDKLTVEPVSGTQLIKVSYLHPDPNMAAKIVNQLVSDFVQHTFQVRYNAISNQTEWLGRQLVELKSEVEKSQARAVQLQKNAGILGKDEHDNIVVARLEELNNQVTSAEADRVVKEAVYKLSRSQDPELIAGLFETAAGRTATDGVSPAALLNALRQQEATVHAEYADAAAKYGPAYPRLVQIKEKLAAIRSSINAQLRKVKEQAKSDYQLAVSREAAARRAFAEQKAIAASMNDRAIDFNIAQREAVSARTLYERLLEKVKEATVLAGLHSNLINVVDAAGVPTRPARPNVPLYLLIGCVAGLVLGVVCVSVVETMDQTVRDVGELETSTYAPVLGVIPRITTGGGGRQHGFKLLAVNHAPEATEPVLMASLHNPAVAEAFRVVRTSLLLSYPQHAVRVVLVTSGTAQEGKTFAAFNLAAALARSVGDVLLVDADLRRGSLSRALGQDSEPGLSHALSGEVEPRVAYRRFETIPGLVLLAAGSSRRCAPELLESTRMADIMHSWREEFAYVVIVSPPVLPVTDAVVLSPAVDAVVVVVRFAVTNLHTITRSIRVLRDVQAPRLGVIVNDIDVHSPEYSRYSAPSARYHDLDAGGRLFIASDPTPNGNRKSA